MLCAHALDYDVQRTCSKRFEHQTAIAPQALFAFGSNSCEIDGWRTLIHAEMGQHPKQMSKKFSSMASLKRDNFPCPHLLAATGGQALKLKGHIKSKGPRCNQPTVLHESWVSQAHRWKGLAFSLQGHLLWIEMCSRIILPRWPFQLLHSIIVQPNGSMTCYSSSRSSQFSHHTLLNNPSESTNQTGLSTTSISKKACVTCTVYFVIQEDFIITSRWLSSAEFGHCKNLQTGLQLCH